MSVELICLAYDESYSQDIWDAYAIKDLLALVLEDQYRKKIDFRSIRYHTGHLQLISNIEELMFQGADNLTLNQCIAKRFSSSVEANPFINSSIIDFDYQWIKYFSALASNDSFIESEKIFKKIFETFGHDMKNWTLFDLEDSKDLFKCLNELRPEHLKAFEDNGHVNAAKQIEHFLEFFRFTFNNKLNAFLYNPETDQKNWGALSSRNNVRNQNIVRASMKQVFTSLKQKARNESLLNKINFEENNTENVALKHKKQKEVDYLLSGINDFDPLVQQKSAESLVGLLSTMEHFEFLKKKYYEVDDATRVELIRVISKIESEKCAVFLKHIIEDTNESNFVQMVASFELIKRNDTDILDIILRKILHGYRYFALLTAFIPDLKKFKQNIKRAFEPNKWTSMTRFEDIAYVLGHLKLKFSSDFLQSILSAEHNEITTRNALNSLRKVDLDTYKTISKRFKGHASVKVNDCLMLS